MAEEKLVQGNNELCEILEHIKQGHNFLLSGGAGSGKTYFSPSITAHLWIISKCANCMHHIYKCCCNRDKEQSKHKNLRVSTIHDFLWDMIAQFQKKLKSHCLN